MWPFSSDRCVYTFFTNSHVREVEIFIVNLMPKLIPLSITIGSWSIMLVWLYLSSYLLFDSRVCPLSRHQDVAMHWLLCALITGTIPGLPDTSQHTLSGQEAGLCFSCVLHSACHCHFVRNRTAQWDGGMPLIPEHWSESPGGPEHSDGRPHPQMTGGLNLHFK